MIYGAYGYSGKLIAELAKEKGLTPVLAGRDAARTQAVADKFGCQWRAFDLDNPTLVAEQLADIDAVIHCAGPFSATSAPMVEACIKSKTHYFDITGEMNVFEYAHSKAINEAAQTAGILVCPGIGFDVIPTDSVAKVLIDALPDATDLHLGFSGDMALSPGTAKSMVEGLAMGTFGRRNGVLQEIPLQVDNIDYGKGPKQSMSVSWGDISTAFYTTGIPNITVSWPASNADIRQAKFAAWCRPIIRLNAVQNFLKKQIDKKVTGPDAAVRGRALVYVWGEARNAAGKKVTARLQTANGYTITQQAPVAIIEYFANKDVPAGSLTPSILLGTEFITQLPDSSEMVIS
jgi:short subunit dehydrogenase-like uncharacterized protein